MSMYWILFIGIAIISYIVQASLQSKFKKYSKNATIKWHDRKRSSREDVA